MIGETIKDFKIVARLGKGGMGEVWAAEQQIIKTRVAIKLLAEGAADQAAIDRFFNEAIAVSKIPHAGIVKIFDVGFDARGRAFLIMELLEGESLGARLRAQGRLPVARVADVGRQIASVLAATHAAGITHRDLKPDNIFLVPDLELPGGERVKILDFGIAKLGPASAANLTATGNAMGTPAYMAPEQWRDAAHADGRADTYALGCLTFELLCGRPPFVAPSIGEACTQHLTVPPPRVRSLAPQLPLPFDELLVRMLAKDPAERPDLAAVEAGFTALATGAGGSIDATLPAGLAPPPAALAPSPPAVTTLGGAAGAVAAATTPAPRAARRWWLAVPVVALVAGAAVLYARRDADAPAPPTHHRHVVTPVDAAVLRAPTLGLAALDKFHDPQPGTASDLRSESMWLAARDDLADAAQQRGAPARWSAARDFAEGEAAMDRGAVPDARAAFARAVAADANWALPYVGLASATSAAGDLEGALTAARHAQRLEPTWWQAVAAAARAYAAAHRLDDAIQEYRRAAELAPKNAIVLAETALAYHAAHMDADAERYATAALAIDDTLVPVHLLRAERALEAGDGSGALVEADRVIAVSPKNPAAHLAKGDAYALLRDAPHALDEYGRAIAGRADVPGPPDPRLALAQKAIETHVLPPPRGGGKATPRAVPTPANSGRTRPGCQAGNPMCSDASL